MEVRASYKTNGNDWRIDIVNTTDPVVEPIIRKLPRDVPSNSSNVCFLRVQEALCSAEQSVSARRKISQMGVHVTEISEVDEQLCGNVRKSIGKMLKQLPPVNKECNIFRVHKELHKMNLTAYDPQVISIGPFHHRRKDLRFTKPYKLQCLKNFLRRMDNNMGSSDEDILKVLVETTHTWVKEARNCYGEPINMNDENFVKMMLVDGCFLVEIIAHRYFPRNYHFVELMGFPTMQTNVDHSLHEGKIHGKMADLIKLENQVPFFVLQRLYDLIPNNAHSISFIKLTSYFFDLGWVCNYELSDEILSRKLPKHFVDFLSFYFEPYMPQDIQKKDDENSKEKSNSLRFFCRPLCCHKQNLSKKTVNKEKKSSTFFCFLSCCHRQKQHEDNNDEKKWIPPSITELCEAGVTIKKAENAKSVMNISFEKGILEIPPLIIDDYFEIIMRNLLAFEQFHIGNTKRYVTQYVLFMDYLISTKKDVNLLVKAGIIINGIGGSDKEVSELFNNLGKFIEFQNYDYYVNVNKDLLEHCSKCWNKSKASLKHNYCNTPWTFISFLAATFLIVLTLLQTIFSGISTFKPFKPIPI